MLNYIRIVQGSKAAEMKPETRLNIGKWIMIGGLVAIAFGIIMITGYSIPEAHAQNMTEYNETLNLLDNTFNQQPNLSISYLVIFLVAFGVFMAAGLILRKKQWAGTFAIAALIMGILTAFYFMVPVDFTYVTNDTKITAEQIEWLDGNHTQNTAVVKNQNISVILPYDPQLRLVLSALFMVLAVFNGLLAILIITNQLEKQ